MAPAQQAVGPPTCTCMLIRSTIFLSAVVTNAPSERQLGTVGSSCSAHSESSRADPSSAVRSSMAGARPLLVCVGDQTMGELGHCPGHSSGRVQIARCRRSTGLVRAPRVRQIPDLRNDRRQPSRGPDELSSTENWSNARFAAVTASVPGQIRARANVTFPRRVSPSRGMPPRQALRRFLRRRPRHARRSRARWRRSP